MIPNWCQQVREYTETLCKGKKVCGGGGGAEEGRE